MDIKLILFLLFINSVLCDLYGNVWQNHQVNPIFDISGDPLKPRQNFGSNIAGVTLGGEYRNNNGMTFDTNLKAHYNNDNRKANLDQINFKIGQTNENGNIGSFNIGVKNSNNKPVVGEVGIGYTNKNGLQSSFNINPQKKEVSVGVTVPF